jgi:hypothetical protein
VNDPHLDALTYRLQQAEDIEYSAPPLTFTTPEFTGELVAGVLTLRPARHFDSPEPFRDLVEPFLASWRIDAGLKYGRDHFRFLYDGASVIDRAPTPGTGAITQTATVRATGDVFHKVTRPEYPTPPSAFRVTPEVEVLWDRFNGYLAQREPLPSMAYFCLTLLERGDRKAAAAHFNIDIDVLRKLGELSSTRGDNSTARKAHGATQLRADERRWIEEAIKATIRRLGTGQGKPLTMADLPKL